MGSIVVLPCPLEVACTYTGIAAKTIEAARKMTTIWLMGIEVSFPQCPQIKFFNAICSLL
jgi:hypothetical protein